MNERLDNLLAQLRAQATDRALGALEIDVQHRLARRERVAGVGFTPVRALAVGLAMMFGTGIGGFTAAAVAAPKPSLFADADALAPSTLLDGARAR